MNIKINKKLIFIHIVFFIVLIVGVSIGFWMSRSFYKVLPQKSEAEYREKKNKSLVNPLLECDDNFITVELNPFSEEVNFLIKSLIAEKKIENMSIRFRDINNATIFQINPDVKYVPASLLKVPVMMSIFKKSESNPGILSEEIKYSGDIKISFFNSESDIKEIVGKSYTVEQLIENMILYSDNTALSLLANRFSKEIDFDSIYNDLNVDLNDITQVKPFFTTSMYSRFLMVLYNASYLSEENSKKALTLLTNVKWNKGITAELPSNIKVAHKYGVREGKDSVEMHDCGIVYFPNKPYLICIMTKGKSVSGAEFAISKVSKFVYDQISQQAKMLSK